jgi:amidohydrolase
VPDDPKLIARQAVEDAESRLIGLSHSIHANPEPAFAEEQASGWVANALADDGFRVDAVDGLPTAFVARVGSGPLRIGICAEYDALPGVGHACGHNVIAAAAVGAGLALRRIADDLGIEVVVLGTPAEEGGGGKILMLERGLLDGLHAALMVHPGPVDALEPPVLAALTLLIRYEGKEAHAAAYPERGVNAADALTVAQVAIGLARQHIRRTDRIHGITTAAGVAPNIIPAESTARYMIRAETLEDLQDVRDRVERCFEAGGIATGARLELTTPHPAYGQMEHHAGLVAAYGRAAVALGRDVTPGQTGALASFSTDMGNVSLAVPSIHPIIGIDSLPAVNHQPEFAAACATPAADRAVIDGAIAMAWTAIDAALEPSLRESLLSRTGGAGG